MVVVRLKKDLIDIAKKNGIDHTLKKKDLVLALTKLGLIETEKEFLLKSLEEFGIYRVKSLSIVKLKSKLAETQAAFRITRWWIARSMHRKKTNWVDPITLDALPYRVVWNGTTRYDPYEMYNYLCKTQKFVDPLTDQPFSNKFIKSVEQITGKKISTRRVNYVEEIDFYNIMFNCLFRITIEWIWSPANTHIAHYFNFKMYYDDYSLRTQEDANIVVSKIIDWIDSQPWDNPPVKVRNTLAKLIGIEDISNDA